MMTIEELLQRILAQIPGEPLEDTVDTVKCGDPTQPLRGIVTTCMATYNVIVRAVEGHANLIITHEPTFYNHRDEIAWLAEDPTYIDKRRLLDEHGIVVWRFHDHWHRHQPDGILTGVVRRLGWEAYATEGIGPFFRLPATTVGALAEELKMRLGIAVVRVVGDPVMSCENVALLPGAAPMRWQIDALAREEIHVAVVGEAREWETVEYVRDSASVGFPKAMILLGHVASEEPGMAYLAEWLRPLVPAAIPIMHVPAGEPFSYV